MSKVKTGGEFQAILWSRHSWE